MFSCSEKFCGSASSGSTFCSMKARVRCLKSSISGESVKSILTSPLDQVSQSGNCPVADRNHCRGKEFIAKGMARWNCDEAYPDFDRRGSTDFFDFARSGRLYRQCTLVRGREHWLRRHRMGLRIWVDRSLPAQRDRRQSRLLPNKSVPFASTALWRAARQADTSP